MFYKNHNQQLDMETFLPNFSLSPGRVQSGLGRSLIPLLGVYSWHSQLGFYTNFPLMEVCFFNGLLHNWHTLLNSRHCLVFKYSHEFYLWVFQNYAQKGLLWRNSAQMNAMYPSQLSSVAWAWAVPSQFLGREDELSLHWTVCIKGSAFKTVAPSSFSDGSVNAIWPKYISLCLFTYLLVRKEFPGHLGECQVTKCLYWPYHDGWMPQKVLWSVCGLRSSYWGWLLKYRSQLWHCLLPGSYVHWK
jgi:hypothetical protein